MKTKGSWQSSLHLIGAFGLIVLCVLAIGGDCCEPDPDEIDVSPSCPDGTFAASSLTIQYDLSGLNDVGVDKQVRISGNRLSGQHNCSVVFPNGASISPAVDLTGQGSGTQTVSNLQDGNWEVRVHVIAGSSTPHPPQTKTGLLSPGASSTLIISNDASGSIQVTF